MKKGPKIWLSIGIALVGVVMVFLCFRKGLEVEVVTMAPQQVVDTFTEDGVAKKGENISIIATVSGDIVELCAAKNSYVKKGSVIAKIKPRDYLYQKLMRQNNVKAYQAQIDETLHNEKYDKKDIAYKIEALKIQLRNLKNNKQQAEMAKVISDSPEEYLEALRLSLDTAQSDDDYCKSVFDSQQKLYQIGAISKNEFNIAANSYTKSQNALRQAEKSYHESYLKLQKLKNLGINGSNLNEKFYQGQDVTLDAAINAAEVQIAALQTKLANDYASDVVNRLKEQIQSEKVAVNQLEDRIRDCEIMAPVSGYITDLAAENLSFVQVGQTIATIKSDHLFLVSVDVLTNAEPYLKVGDAVKLTQKLKSGDRDFTGTIAEIYHFAAESTSALGLKEHRVRVDVAVSDNRAVLKDGYEFDAEFTTYRQKRVLAVPNSAIFKTNDLNYVLKAQKNRAVLTSVRIGHQTNTETVIRSGVARNDQVIYNVNTEGLADGTKIAVKEKRR
jgi:HlyD family secretion protein